MRKIIGLKKFLQLFVFAFVPFLLFCNNTDEKRDSLRIAVAANLRFAIEEINTEFEKKTGIIIDAVTASSGKLTAQIKNGAPYDAFLSANYKYPITLYQEGFAKTKPQLFCQGILVIWTTKDLFPDSTLANLVNPEITKIGIANPQNAPYGIAAEELLKNAGLIDILRTKLVYAENVSQLNQYVINRAVDYGITSKSAVMAPKLTNTGRWKEINYNSYTPVKQYFVKLKVKNSKNDVDKYFSFLSSQKAKKILEKHGYFTD